jgi:hypothetical protein
MIIEINYATLRENKADGSKFYSVRGAISGMPIAGDVSIEDGKLIEKISAYVTGDKENPSPAFLAGVMPCIELHESHYKLADVPRKYTAEDGTEKTDTINDLPVHKISRVRGADETVAGWSLLKSIPRRAAPVKAPDMADSEVAALLAG